MNKTVIVGATFISLLGFTATSMASEACEVLFNGTTSKLSKQDKQQICDMFGFTFTKSKGFVDETCGAVYPEVGVVDLNGDGVMEVFVNYGNTCTSGKTGRTISLYIKDTAGQYGKNLGFPANDYESLSTSNKGFPDLTFGGPGFCHGVWQWDGNRYKHKCNREEKPGGCAWKRVKNICK